MSQKGQEILTAPVKYVFLDIVGYTENRSVEAQSSIIDVLDECVRAEIGKTSVGQEQIVFLPTGRPCNSEQKQEKHASMSNWSFISGKVCGC